MLKDLVVQVRNHTFAAELQNHKVMSTITLTVTIYLLIGIYFVIASLSELKEMNCPLETILERIGLPDELKPKLINNPKYLNLVLSLLFVVLGLLWPFFTFKWSETDND